jgi:hypothetical protein
MSNKFSRLSLGFASLLLFAGGVVIQAPSFAAEAVPDVAGTWKMTVPGEPSRTFTLIQKGNALTGTMQAPMGSLPLTGTVTTNKKVTWTAKFGGLKAKLAGKVEGTTMNGVIDIPMQGKKNFTATK